MASSKVQAGRVGWEQEPVSAVGVGDPGDVGDRGAPADPEVEAEVIAVAAWFESLPIDLRAYLDHEARFGRQAYPWP